MVKINSLSDFYDRGVDMVKGYEFEYNGWTFKKCSGVSDISSSDHSEYKLYNPSGDHVDTLSINSFDSEEEFKNRVEEILS